LRGRDYLKTPLLAFERLEYCFYFLWVFFREVELLVHELQKAGKNEENRFFFKIDFDFFQLYRKLLARTGEWKGDLHSGTGSEVRSFGEEELGLLLLPPLLLLMIFFELGRRGKGGGTAVGFDVKGTRGSGAGEVHNWGIFRISR
jgi:hypothetical protein